MKILIVSNLYPPHYLGGYELACAGIADELRRRGHDVRVLTSTYRVGASGLGERAGGESAAANGGGPKLVQDVHRILEIAWPFQPDERASGRRRSLFYHRRNFRRTRALLREFRPDVVYGWHLRGIGALQILFAAWEARLPVVIHHMDYWMLMLLEDAGGRRTLAGRWLERWISGSLRPRMIFTSRRVQREFADHGWNVADGVVIRHGEDPERIPQADRAERAGHLWRFVFASQILLAKGIGLVVAALRLLAIEYGRGDFILDVIGEGLQKDAARLLVAEAGIGGYVRFLGKVSHQDVLVRLKDYDLLLFPTHEREPGGNIVVEAMMAGCVVITSNVGGQSELVRDGVTGCTVPIGASALARRIHQLMTDEQLFLELSRNAATFARRELALSRIADQVIDVIADATASSRPALGALPERLSAVPR